MIKTISAQPRNKELERKHQMTAIVKQDLPLKVEKKEMSYIYIYIYVFENKKI